MGSEASTDPLPPRLQETPGGLSISSGKTNLASYVTAPDVAAIESPRPYLHPIRTLGGTVVSDYRPADHDWHWGLSIAVSNIAVEGEELPVNVWGGVTFTGTEGYVQLDNNGSQVHESFTAVDQGMREHLRWSTATGRSFLSEERTLLARVVPVPGAGAAWRLDVSTVWTNITDGILRFGSPTTAGRVNAGYGGLFLRGAGAFTDATVVTPRPGGDPMGQTGPWLALARDSATVAMAACPANPVAPTPWFVRTETPMLCAAPFFHEEWLLAAHDSATWGWSLLIADGRLDAGQVSAVFADA
ncbi:hypothetical protein IWX78_000103 [Mycetocola sp. CAN_C7]|uniref:DUF6807 domain-containing protein n=1 Tax=Mycetocola sp. CAN_C7 TaxID=2787724 RepID=UPI0018C95863